ncbi:MAG: hypothetical protein BGO14_10930 [Chlamydiales bacterium 38-26]|nr:hypothetical protein [Chlamydiales bacterium]OJV11465.1 MAG: hypothetical protein BGO14_10930 [Chlamydiales bacterium 38-26]
MNVNPHANTQRTIGLENENNSLSLGQANSSQKVSQDSESKTTQIALHCLEEPQESICVEIKNIVANLSPETNRTELAGKVECLVKKLNSINVNEEIQKNLNHLQLDLYKEGFKDLSEKIRDRVPFAWDDLPPEMQHYILSQMSFEELLKIPPSSKEFREVVDLEIIKILPQLSFEELLKIPPSSKEFRVVVDLEIIKRINNNKIDLSGRAFPSIKRALKNHGAHLTYLGLISGECTLPELADIIESCPNLEEITLGFFSRLKSLADVHAVILAKFAGESKLSQLKKLEFLPGSIGLKGVKAIAESSLNSLISLKLVGSDLGDEGFACICQSSSLINLKVLDFSHNQMTPEGLHAIAEAKFKLEELYLRSNQIVSFANNLDNLQDLKILDLSENQMNAEALETILKLSEHALTRLNLSHNQLTDENLPQVAQLENSKLKVLNLADNNISFRGIEKIIPLIPHLTGLYLDNNKELDSWGLKLILKEKPKLAELCLSGTSIGEEGVIKIFDFENFSFLRKLNIGKIELSNNFWAYVGGLNFKQVRLGSNLEELELSYPEDDQEKIRSLLESFPLKRLGIFIPLEKLLGNDAWELIDNLGLPYGCEITRMLEN